MRFSFKKCVLSILAVLILMIIPLMPCAQAKAENHTYTSPPRGSHHETFDDSYRYYGDLNNDGKVNMIDVTLMQRKIAGLVKFDSDTYKEDMCASDLNNDFKVNMEDVVLCQRKIALLIKRFPVGVLFHKLK